MPLSRCLRHASFGRYLRSLRLVKRVGERSVLFALWEGWIGDSKKKRPVGGALRYGMYVSDYFEVPKVGLLLEELLVLVEVLVEVLLPVDFSRLM